jgi:predicted RecB family endonuclease
MQGCGNYHVLALSPTTIPALAALILLTLSNRQELHSIIESKLRTIILSLIRLERRITSSEEEKAEEIKHRTSSKAQHIGRHKLSKDICLCIEEITDRF